jgi:hypothetical protein
LGVVGRCEPANESQSWKQHQTRENSPEMMVFSTSVGEQKFHQIINGYYKTRRAGVQENYDDERFKNIT